MSMHAYENSNSTQFKESNWIMLERAFKFLKLPFDKSDYKDIRTGNFDQLVDFMVKLYQQLTQRT